jgi:hypothetical protein
MEIKRFIPENFAQLREVFKRVYPSNPRLNEWEYIEWQFRTHPLNQDDQYTLWVLWDGPQISGFYGWVPVQVAHNGSLLKGCEPTLWWAEESAKAGGLQLLEKIMNDFPVRIYHDCSPDSLKIFRPFGMPLFSLPRWVLVLDLDQACSLFEINLPPLPDSKKSADASRVSRLNRFPDNAEMAFDLWPDIESHLYLTGNVLNWRYFDIPNHDYRLITTERKGQYGVYRIEKIKGYEVSVMRILEWNFSSEEGWQAMAFLREEAAKEKVILMDFFCSSPAIGKALEAYGFVSSDVHPFYMIPRLFRPICTTSDMIICIDMPPYRHKEAVKFQSWYLTKGNSDMDRIKL